MGQLTSKRNILSPCVLLVSPGRADGHVYGVMRSLGQQGISVHIIVVSESSTSAKLYSISRFCKSADIIYLAPNDNSFGEQLIEFGRKKNFACPPVMIPLTDNVCTYLSECSEQVGQYYDLCMPRSELIIQMLDKTQADSIARKNGLLTPETRTAGSSEQLHKAAKEMTLPVIVKPTWWRTRGESYFKAIVCKTEDELFTTGTKAIENGANLLIQQYIPGGDETVEVYMFYRSKDGETIHGCTGTKIRQVPPGTGSMASGKSTWLPQTAEMSDNFLRNIDYRGLGGIEYKRHNGKSYFIEMSVRPEGFNQLAVEAGVNLPWLAYQDIVMGNMPQKRIQQREAYYFKELAYITLWRKYRHSFPIYKEALLLLFNGKTIFNLWSWKDPIPFFAVIATELVNALKGIFKKLFINRGEKQK